MRTLLVINLLLCLKGNSQSQLGRTYSQVLRFIENDDKVQDITSEITTSGKSYLIAKFKDGYFISEAFYFDDGKNPNSICVVQTLGIDDDQLNSTVKSFDKDYVKVSELQWKDYKNKQILTISMLESCFVVEIKPL